MDNKHRKLFVIKQSKGCKFMPKMHQNAFGGQAPPGPAKGAYALPQTKLRKVYCWVCQWKKLKSLNIWQSYKQERDCFVHFPRLLAVCWLLTPPPHLKYVATLSCNLSLMACFADINVSLGSVATYARCGGISDIHLTANLPKWKKFLNRLRIDRNMVMSM